MNESFSMRHMAYPGNSNVYETFLPAFIFMQINMVIPCLRALRAQYVDALNIAQWGLAEEAERCK